MDLLAHQRMLTAIASGLVGPAEADDIVQETFLRALANPPADRDASIAPWLVTVARNLAMDVLRRRVRFVAEVDEGESEQSTPPSGDRPSTTPLAGLGQLSEGEVAVLLLREWMDLDVDEVATALDTSAGSVRVLHHRARRKAAVAAPLEETAKALDRFVTWLLGRVVEGLPAVGKRAYDPGHTQGVLAAYLRLLDALIELACTQAHRGVEGRARLSRGIVRATLGQPDAIEDLERAIELGARRTLAEARLAPLLYSRGDTDRALATVLSALGRGDDRHHEPVLHRIAARVYSARGDAAGAEPHLAALRALSDSEAHSAYAAFARGTIAIDEERFADARTDSLLALERNRASAAHSRNEAGILNNLALAALGMGELDEASAWAKEGLALARSMGSLRIEALLHCNMATIAHLGGRLDEAAAGYERAVELFEQSGQGLHAETARTHGAALAHRRGDVDDAVTALEGVVGRLANVPGASLLPRIHLLAARAERGEADVASFDALSEEAQQRPSLVRALALYRLLVERDRDAMARALAEPGGTAPEDRIARAIVERVVKAAPPRS